MEFDEQVVRGDKIKDLLPEFVCVRMVQANDLDLNLFQFDYDMSFALFFMNADNTIYGRYGTRNGNAERSDDHISLEGLREAMTGALALHKNVARYKPRLAAKSAPSPDGKQNPLEFPELKKKFGPSVNYQNKDVAKTCLHCHQINGERRKTTRLARQPISDKLLFQWPMPDTVGLSMNPQKRATVQQVKPQSPAATAGVRPGDTILAIQSQPIISTADIQWVLHNAGETDTLQLLVRRGGQTRPLNLTLSPGWRRNADISWRVSTWDMRRMALGGMKLEAEPNNRSGKMALKAIHVGQYNEHAIAKRAGVKKGDVLLEFNGLSNEMSEQELITHTMQNTKPGDVVAVKLKRGGRVIDTKIKLP